MPIISAHAGSAGNLHSSDFAAGVERSDCLPITTERANGDTEISAERK